MNTFSTVSRVTLDVLDSNPPYVFDRAALRAVRKYRYSPMMVGGSAAERSGQKIKLDFEPPKGSR